MAGVINVLRDAAGALDYAVDVLEAPPRASIRDTARELKEARQTVAELLAYTERLLGFAYGYGDPTAIAAGEGLLDGARDAIAKARGEA